MQKESGERRREFEVEALVHLDILYNVALRLCSDASDAEDLVQETFVKAYRSWDRYERGTNCRAWLLTIMRNTFISKFRRESRRPAPVSFESVDGTTVLESPQPEDPEEWLSRFTVGEEVERAIQELPEEFRLPVVFRDVGGMRYDEIAEILGVPVGAVKSRLFRGRRRLRRRLHEYALETGCGR
jgi:RNA polymerase sigma-70 factor (ECF subfamily)